MRRTTLLALLLGIMLGVAGTFGAVELAGGWWTYQLMNNEFCNRSMQLGTTHVAPNQPNPCLFRSPRWWLFN